MLPVNPKWGKTLRKAMVSGAVASVLSTISLAFLGKSELDRTAAPVNGPSQWIWGRHAPFKNRFSWQYTVVGYAIHHAASVFWAILHEKHQEQSAPAASRNALIVPAIVTTAAAYVVDFYVVPKRLTPGFEQRLSKPALFIVYGTFALGLAGGALINRHYAMLNKTKELSNAPPSE
jgi:hypothetical protein